MTGADMASAQELIASLDLKPHPEGGFYRETWRAEATPSGRSASTAILFLLPVGARSHWHKVDADELWFWQGGDPLTLQIAEADNAAPRTILLGPATAPRHNLQGIVPRDQWQSAEPSAGPCGYSLVSCVVAPGFSFDGFILAAPGWSPGA